MLGDLFLQSFRHKCLSRLRGIPQIAHSQVGMLFLH